MRWYISNFIMTISNKPTPFSRSRMASRSFISLLVRQTRPIISRGFGVATRTRTLPTTSRGLTTPTLRAKRGYSASTVEKKCQFCGSIGPLWRPLCASCLSPSPIPESQVSFYDFFHNTPPPQGTFTLDTRALRREFLQLQQTVHPDKFSHDEKKRLVAESTSSLLNKAYTTLLSPLSRAEYLLHQHYGHDFVAEGESLTDGKLLMTVMELRECIDEATTESDLEPVKRDVKRLIDEELSALEQAFSKQDFETAKMSAVRLRYWQNIQKAALDWESGAEIVIHH